MDNWNFCTIHHTKSEIKKEIYETDFVTREVLFNLYCIDIILHNNRTITIHSFFLFLSCFFFIQLTGTTTPP